jgi:putative transposase
MSSEKPYPNRRSIRLKDYDYASDGAYFVTLCTAGKASRFGDVVQGTEQDVVMLNDVGEIIRTGWLWLETQYSYVFLDAFVIMPNHFHGILFLSDSLVETYNLEPHTPVRAVREPPVQSSALPASGKRKPLGRLIGVFKTITTREVNKHYRTSGMVLWHRNYYERELMAIRQYVQFNPARWLFDRYFAD